MAKEKKVHLRRCCGCGGMKEKEALIRVIRNETGEVLLDDTHRKNGRGAYLCRSLSCLETAQKRRALDRALKCTAGPDIYGLIREKIEAAQ